MNDIITKYLKKLKSPKILMIVGIGGIILIYLSTLFSGADKDTELISQQVQPSAEQYRMQLEENIAGMVKSIIGSDNVTVVITLESGIRYSYAKQDDANSATKTESGATSESSESKQTYITVKTADGGEQALLVTEHMPEVRGVAIVCEGGDNAEISERIENAVMAALNITSKRVYIAGGITYEKR